MSATILDAIQDLATPSMINSATTALGISDKMATAGLAAASTSILGGLLQGSADSKLMTKVASLASSMSTDSSVFANVAGMFSGGIPSSQAHLLGNKLLGLLFGDKMSSTIAAIATASGISTKAASGLATLAAPMVLAALRTRLGSAANAAGLVLALNADKSTISTAMPAALRALYGLASAPAAASAPSAPPAAAPAAAKAAAPAPTSPPSTPPARAVPAPAAAAPQVAPPIVSPALNPLSRPSIAATLPPQSTTAAATPGTNSQPTPAVANAPPRGAPLSAPSTPAVKTADAPLDRSIPAAPAKTAPAPAPVAAASMTPRAQTESGYASGAPTPASTTPSSPPMASSVSAPKPAASAPTLVPAAAPAPAPTATPPAPASAPKATGPTTPPTSVPRTAPVAAAPAATKMTADKTEGETPNSLGVGGILALVVPLVILAGLLWYWAYGIR